jgi:hypothetical protein
VKLGTGRLFLAFLTLAMVCGCQSPRPAAPPWPPLPPLHLQPITDLAPAAGLRWLIAARPRDVAQVATLIPAIEQIVPSERFRAFAERNGGVDLRAPSEIVVARYDDSTLWLVHTAIDPARVEQAFGARLLHVDGRSIDRPTTDPLASIVRTWGSFGGDQEQLVLFGREALGLDIGRSDPLRAAELFAMERLKRASPALRTDPLRQAARLLGDAPLLAFAPGPFTGEAAGGLGGLLGAATAVAGGARIVDAGNADRPGLAITVVLLGAWGNDGQAAADRLLSAFGVLADSGIGRLLGARSPIAPARVRASPEALTLEVTIDAFTLAAGLHDATGATVDAIMDRWPRHPH